jgi:hypothetical protein
MKEREREERSLGEIIIFDIICATTKRDVGDLQRDRQGIRRGQHLCVSVSLTSPSALTRSGLQ